MSGEGGTQVKHLHFISGFEEAEGNIAGYRCLRCGAQRLTPEGCYQHRQGFISECRKARLKAWRAKFETRGERQ